MLMAIDGLHMRESKMRRVKLTFFDDRELVGRILYHVRSPLVYADELKFLNRHTISF